MKRGGTMAALAAVALLCAACGGGGDGGDSDGGGDAGDGGGMDSGGGDDARVPMDSGPQCRTALPVDMLWVIDNSNSMSEEQASLAINFPTLVDVLTSPPDDDGDGEPDWPAVEDLRMGVVSTDLGVGSHADGVSGCTAEGDDGVLVSDSRRTDPDCDGFTVGPPPWLQFMAGDDAAALADDFSCVAHLGTGGCGLEQQLESAHVALNDRAAAGEPNEGFLREDSLLAVVLVTDEDDCSAPGDEIFDPSSEAESSLGPYGTRCADNADLLHPVSRYVDGLESLRAGRDQELVVGAITGVPRDLVANPDAIDYDALLADEDMQFRPDPEREGQLTPACSVEGRGSAIPGRRIVQVIQPFADSGRGIVQSICAEDFRPAIEAIARLIGSRLCGPVI